MHQGSPLSASTTGPLGLPHILISVVAGRERLASYGSFSEFWMSTAVLLVVRAYANFEATCDARALALELVHGGVWGVSFSLQACSTGAPGHTRTHTHALLDIFTPFR